MEEKRGGCVICARFAETRRKQRRSQRSGGIPGGIRGFSGDLGQLLDRYELSSSGDSGMPEVVADPQGEVARTFQNLGVCVVQQCAKIRQQVSTAVFYDKLIRAIRVRVPGSDDEFFLHPATVRRNDRSAQSVDEWTGEQKMQYGDVPEDIEPEDIRPMGNYAVSITWPDGFSQIAPYDQLQTMERLIEAPLLTS